MMFFYFACEIGDAFCFICLPNLTDVATNDDRLTEATRESVLVFLFGGSSTREGSRTSSVCGRGFLFFEACPFRLLQWFLDAISCAEQFCRVHTIYISVLGGMCTASDHQKPAIHIMC